MADNDSWPILPATRPWGESPEMDRFSKDHQSVWGDEGDVHHSIAGRPTRSWNINDNIKWIDDGIIYLCLTRAAFIQCLTGTGWWCPTWIVPWTWVCGMFPLNPLPASSGIQNCEPCPLGPGGRQLRRWTRGRCSSYGAVHMWHRLQTTGDIVPLLIYEYNRARMGQKTLEMRCPQVIKLEWGFS